MANTATVIGGAVSAVPLALGIMGGLSGRGPSPAARDPLELSRAVSALSQQCRREADDLRAERGATLIALSGGQVVFDQFQTDSDAAAATASAAIQKAHADRAKAEREAQSVRRTESEKADADQRDADAKSRDEERAAETKAQRTFDDDMRQVDRLPLSEQSRPRRDAQDKRDRALANARDDLNFALQRNREAMQRQRQDALDKERRAGEAAAENEDIALKAADAERSQAMQRADAKLRASFQSIAGASAILTDFDARLAEHDRECRERINALLRPTPGGRNADH